MLVGVLTRPLLDDAGSVLTGFSIAAVFFTDLLVSSAKNETSANGSFFDATGFGAGLAALALALDVDFAVVELAFAVVAEVTEADFAVVLPFAAFAAEATLLFTLEVALDTVDETPFVAAFMVFCKPPSSC